MNGTTIVFAGTHNLTVGSIIYDYENNESRVVTAVTNTSTVVVDTAFTSQSIENVYKAQDSDNKVHNHTLSGTFTTKNTIQPSTTVAKSLTGTADFSEPGSNIGCIHKVTGMITSSNYKTESMIHGNVVSSYSTMTVNAEHRHQIDLSGNTGKSGSEARPINFTCKIWVRVA